MRCLEAGEPLGVGDGKEQVIVIGHEDKGLDVDRVEALSPGERPGRSDGLTYQVE